MITIMNCQKCLQPRVTEMCFVAVRAAIKLLYLEMLHYYNEFARSPRLEIYEGAR